MEDLGKVVALSVESAVKGMQEDFEKDFPDVSLVETRTLIGLSFSGLKPTVILHLHGGGSVPYGIGSWRVIKEVVGSLVSIGVYKKHQ